MTRRRCAEYLIISINIAIAMKLTNGKTIIHNIMMMMTKIRRIHLQVNPPYFLVYTIMTIIITIMTMTIIIINTCVSFQWRGWSWRSNRTRAGAQVQFKRGEPGRNTSRVLVIVKIVYDHHGDYQKYQSDYYWCKRGGPGKISRILMIIMHDGFCDYHWSWSWS